MNISDLKRLADHQAKDEGLFFITETASEAYLQDALRKLHGMIELVDDGWISVETDMPDKSKTVYWWLVGKPPEECVHDTSGNPLSPNCSPYIHHCKTDCWPSVMKPSHWREPLSPPNQTEE